MLVVCDNKVFAEKVLICMSSKSKKKIDKAKLCIWNWEEIQNDLLPEEVKTIVSKLFQKKVLYQITCGIHGGWRYLFLVKNALGSQYDVLRSLCRAKVNLPDGVLCLASSGKKFHGFKNRAWESIEGNIHLSVHLTPNKHFEHPIGFTVLSAVSALEAIDSLGCLKEKASIKWVNDVLIDNAKVCGVLANTYCEGDKINSVVLGIGLNVEATPKIRGDLFVHRATSLLEHAYEGSKLRLGEVFKILLDRLECNYQKLLAGKYIELLDLYRERSIVMGEKVRIIADTDKAEELAKGRVIKIGDDLELYLDESEEPIRFGRLSHEGF